MVAMLEWIQTSQIAGAIGSVAFRMCVVGLVPLREVMLTAILLDVSELQRTTSSVLSIDAAYSKASLRLAARGLTGSLADGHD